LAAISFYGLPRDQQEQTLSSLEAIEALKLANLQWTKWWLEMDTCLACKRKDAWHNSQETAEACRLKLWAHVLYAAFASRRNHCYAPSWPGASAGPPSGCNQKGSGRCPITCASAAVF